MKTSLLFCALLLLFTLSRCTSPAQQSTYSIVGTWKLVSMQFDGNKKEHALDESLSQSQTRFVYEKSGQFRMILDTEGRGLKGGYFYDPETNILSIMYGAHTDTALVSWVNINRMIHTTVDGKTTTVLEREKK